MLSCGRGAEKRDHPKGALGVDRRTRWQGPRESPHSRRAVEDWKERREKRREGPRRGAHVCPAKRDRTEGRGEALGWEGEEEVSQGYTTSTSTNGRRKLLAFCAKDTSVPECNRRCFPIPLFR